MGVKQEEASDQNDGHLVPTHKAPSLAEVVPQRCRCPRSQQEEKRSPRREQEAWASLPLLSVETEEFVE